VRRTSDYTPSTSEEKGLRRLTLLLTAGIAALAPILLAQSTGPYKVLKTARVGGEGGTDYIFPGIRAPDVAVPPSRRPRGLEHLYGPVDCASRIGASAAMPAAAADVSRRMPFSSLWTEYSPTFSSPTRPRRLTALTQ